MFLYKINFLGVLLFFPLIILGQQTSFRFDFGSGTTAKNYMRITPETKFSYRTGYGFDQG